jgi:hypothetical protein
LIASSPGSAPASTSDHAPDAPGSRGHLLAPQPVVACLLRRGPPLHGPCALRLDLLRRASLLVLPPPHSRPHQLPQDPLHRLLLPKILLHMIRL